jgi:hypothetical protein
MDYLQVGAPGDQHGYRWTQNGHDNRREYVENGESWPTDSETNQKLMQAIVFIIEHDIPNVTSALKIGCINAIVFKTFDHTLLEKTRDSMYVQIKNTWRMPVVWYAVNKTIKAKPSRSTLIRRESIVVSVRCVWCKSHTCRRICNDKNERESKPIRFDHCFFLFSLSF